MKKNQTCNFCNAAAHHGYVCYGLREAITPIHSPQQVPARIHPSAATSTSTSSQETTGMETSSMETEGDGIIDGLMNDVEKGANDVKDGVDDITGESNTVNESGTNNTTEAR